MTQLWPAGQPINVVVDTHGVPTVFVWQTQRHTIHQVIQGWDVDLDWWQPEGRIWRTYHALITHNNLLCVIYFDHLTATWQLVRLYD